MAASWHNLFFEEGNMEDKLTDEEAEKLLENLKHKREFIQLSTTLILPHLDTPACLVVTGLANDGTVWVRSGCDESEEFEYFGRCPQTIIEGEKDETTDSTSADGVPVAIDI